MPYEENITAYGYPNVNDSKLFTPFYDTVQAIRPGPLGGVNWPPSSYNPELGYLYVCANDSTGRYIIEKLDASHKPVPGEIYTGGPPGLASLPFTGIFAAVNLRNNTIEWRQRWSDTCYSGSVSTAGDLVFTGRNDGRFVALNAHNGNVLWEFQTGAGVNAPATVFQHKDKQYLLVYSAGNLFAGSPGGDSVWLFSLDGTLEPVAPYTPAITQSIDLEGADIQAGSTVFSQFCSQCHGKDAKGGHGGGPSLLEVDLANTVISAVTEGKNTMPSFSGALTHDQIRDVVMYVVEGL